MPRRMRWAVHVWVEERFIQGFGGETLRFYLEDLDADGRIILKWVLKKCNGMHGLN